jgi:alkanesulfonate monooxygenase SsuD/methylene tetrahydromethanopterin reductase-like flavin-dependent oxidoreductase (luciferase family)
MLLAGSGDGKEGARMRVGLHIPDFTWDGGPAALGVRLGEVARLAEQAGVDRISVMDHVWQIGHLGPPEHEMLEAYTTLGWLAAQTERVKLLTVVTAVVYRDPGLLAKAVTTLDVLSGGRAMLGIGAAWNEEEARGLGLFFPPLAERFERREEALPACSPGRSVTRDLGRDQGAGAAACRAVREVRHSGPVGLRVGCARRCAA